MKVTIIGTGYVGLVTGIFLSDVGHNVVCFDTNKAKINDLKQSILPFYERDLDKIFTKNQNNQKITFSNNLFESISNSDVSIICVGTPLEKNKINLEYIKSASSDIAENIKFAKNFHVVCLKSTVTPGTTENLVGKIIEEKTSLKAGNDFGLSMNPEFLAEGSAVEDAFNPDRIIIGANERKSFDILSEMYSPIKCDDVIFTNIKTAEMIKYTANSFLATTISFSNEIANICESIDDVDVMDVMKGVHLDKRLSPIIKNKRITPGLMSFLSAGTGFGGSCFPKDLESLIFYSKEINADSKILKSVIDINKKQILKTVKILFDGFKDHKIYKVLILGLSFKPGTSDVRESPAINVIKELLKRSIEVFAHDPIAIPNMKSFLKDERVKYEENFSTAIQNKDAIILITSWPEYKNLDKVLKDKKTIIIDGRRFLDKNSFDNYAGIGWKKNK